AEDGIRYLTVTGVQTCALPISLPPPQPPSGPPAGPGARRPGGPRRSRAPRRVAPRPRTPGGVGPALRVRRGGRPHVDVRSGPPEIGRASCRERVEVSVVGGALA